MQESTLPTHASLSLPTKSIWVTTTVNELIECNQYAVQESALLTILEKYGTGTDKKNPLAIKLTANQLKLFTKACSEEKTIYSLSNDQQFDLCKLAQLLKAPQLYALLV